MHRLSQAPYVQLVQPSLRQGAHVLGLDAKLFMQMTAQSKAVPTEKLFYLTPVYLYWKKFFDSTNLRMLFFYEV